MVSIVSNWRSFAGGLVIAAGILSGALGLMAAAQTEIQDELMGARVYAAGGVEVGEVAALTIGEDGQVAEVRVTTTYPLGFGQRVVVLRQGSFITLRGAIVVDMSPEQFNALPSARAPRGTLAQTMPASGVAAPRATA